MIKKNPRNIKKLLLLASAGVRFLFFMLLYTYTIIFFKKFVNCMFSPKFKKKNNKRVSPRYSRKYISIFFVYLRVTYLRYNNMFCIYIIYIIICKYSNWVCSKYIHWGKMSYFYKKNVNHIIKITWKYITTSFRKFHQNLNLSSHFFVSFFNLYYTRARLSSFLLCSIYYWFQNPTARRREYAERYNSQSKFWQL